MSQDTQKITLRQRIIIALTAIALLGVVGCGEVGQFFDKKPTEIQTQELLNELGQPRENPNVRNPLPEIYRAPASKIKVNDGVKLFYFCKNHTVDKLAGLVNKQLGYKVDSSTPTNQLIIHCPNGEDANKTIEFLNAIDVPPIQVNIDCLVLERFADVTMDWETTLLVENFMGEGITFGEKKYPKPAFPGASLRESKRSDFGLDFGYWMDKGVVGHQFRALVDTLVSRGYLPTRQDCFDLLEEYHVPTNIRKHGLAVAELAVFLATRLTSKGIAVDVELIDRA